MSQVQDLLEFVLNRPWRRGSGRIRFKRTRAPVMGVSKRGMIYARWAMDARRQSKFLWDEKANIYRVRKD